MINRLNIGSKIALLVSAILVLLLLLSAAVFVQFQFKFHQENAEKSALEAISILEILHTEAMRNRDDASDDNASVTILDSTMAQLGKTSDRMALWLVQGEKVLDFQLMKKGYQEIPRDDLDHQVLNSGQPASKMTKGHVFRYSRPVIMGKGYAAEPRCYECHSDLMDIRDGEIIGVYSIALNVSQSWNELTRIAQSAFALAIIVSLLIAAISFFLIRKLAGAPLASMTGLMRRLADGDMEVVIPDLERGDEVGQMANAMVVFRDNVLERREAQRGRRASEKYLRTVVDNMMDGLIVIDPSGIVQSFNPAAAGIFGFSEQEVVGNNVSMLMPEPEKSDHDQNMQRYLKGGEARIIGRGREVMAQRKNGEIFPMELSVSEMEIDDRRLFIGTIHDNTLRHEMTQALNESKERFRGFAESASDWFWEMDSDLRFTYVTDRYFELTGTHRENIIGKTRQDLMDLSRPGSDPDLWKHHSKDLKARRPFNDLTFPLRGSSGQITHVSVSGLPFFDENGDFQGYRGTGSDVTKRILGEIALRDAKDEAEAANRAKSEFLANMSHELRTPLNAIIGFSDTIISGVLGQIGNKKYEEYVNHINESGKHLLGLIGNILDLSRIEAGKLEFSPETIDVGQFILELEATIQPIILKNGNSFEVTCPQDIGSIHNDPVALRQILFNLIDNAGKFTNEGSIELSVRRDVQNNGETIVFSLSDTGMGLSEEQIEGLFQPFQQGDSSVTKRYGGTGLGLAITRRLCELMDGEITIDSKPGKGAVFTVILPTRVE